MNWYKFAGAAGLSYISYHLWNHREKYLIKMMKKTAEIQIAATEIIDKIKPLIPENNDSKIFKILEIVNSKFIVRNNLEECNSKNSYYVFWTYKNQELIYFKKNSIEFDMSMLDNNDNNDNNHNKSNILSAVILNQEGLETDISELIRKYEKYNNNTLTIKDIIDNTGKYVFQESEQLVIINSMADISKFKYSDTIKF